MKKSIFAVAVLLLTFASAPAVAASTCSKSIAHSNCFGATKKVTGLNCATTSHFCWGPVDVTQCASCPDGYTLTSRTLSDEECTNTTTYNNCMLDIGGGDGCGTACDNCFSSGWRNLAGNTGYQQKTTVQCDESTNCECVKSYEYRCSAGYYGFRPSCTTIINVGTDCSGCSQCPDVPDKVDWVDESYSITSAAGSTVANQCYIDGTATDHYIADETGYYTIAGGKCYYERSL